MYIIRNKILQNSLSKLKENIISFCSGFNETYTNICMTLVVNKRRIRQIYHTKQPPIPKIQVHIFCNLPTNSVHIFFSCKRVGYDLPKYYLCRVYYTL